MKKTISYFFLCALTLCAGNAHADTYSDPAPNGPNVVLPQQLATLPAITNGGFSSASSLTGSAGLTPVPPGPPLNVGSFNIVIVPGSGLAGNAPALLAFQAAANDWISHFSDPIIVTVNADLTGGFSNPNIIGSTSAVELQAGYTTIRNQIVTDATNFPTATTPVVQALPTSAQFVASVPSSGYSLSGNVSGTKASLKAAGFAGLDGAFGVSDGNIIFNNAFAFDYDRSNGITPGTIDFQTVATHELGHLLGFISTVDDVDGSTPFAITPTTLDLYRFANGGGNDPTGLAQFTTFPRSLVPGAEANTDDGTNAFRMSTGLTQGDGRQASHWKDDSLLGSYVGVMDPTLPSGVIEPITNADLEALDLIGYDLVAVPEPSTIVLLSLGAIGLAINYRRQCCS